MFDSIVQKLLLVLAGFVVKHCWDKWKSHRLLKKGAFGEDDVAFQLVGIDECNVFYLATLATPKLKEIYSHSGAIKLLKGGFGDGECWMRLENSGLQRQVINPILQRISALFAKWFVLRSAGAKTNRFDLVFGLQKLEKGFQWQWRVIIVSKSDLKKLLNLRQLVERQAVTLEYDYLAFQVDYLEQMARLFETQELPGNHRYFSELSLRIPVFTEERASSPAFTPVTAP